MTDREQLERLLGDATGGSVTLPRKQAQDLAQKLRARGGGEGLVRLDKLLASPGDVELAREEAATLLEDLRASGRRWVFGATEPPAPRETATPERETHPAPAPEPAPEPAIAPRRGFFARLLGRG